MEMAVGDIRNSETCAIGGLHSVIKKPLPALFTGQIRPSVRDALSAAQPTVSKHRRRMQILSNLNVRGSSHIIWQTPMHY